MKTKEFLKAIDALVEQKGIKKETIFNDLKEALEKAWKKTNDPYAEVRVDIDEKKGTIRMFRIKHIVEEVEDDAIEMELEDALELDKKYKIGDEVIEEIDPEELNRMAARHAAQILRQKLREAEKTVLYDLYADKVGETMAGIVERVEDNYLLVNLGKGAALMPKSHMIPNENYYVNQPIKVYLVGVEKTNQGAQIIVSRTAPEFLKRLFEQEIHEIYDGTVEIVSIARDAGSRAKVSVLSRNPSVDPTGACIGQKGMRIQKISNQIMGEKIDVINYNENPVLYIVEALKPAEIYGINIDEENKKALAVVMDTELSLAIGKKGQNARLAAKLTGYRIDVKPLNEVKELGIEFKTISSIIAEINAKKEVEEKVVVEEVKKPVKEEKVEEIYVSPSINIEPKRVSLSDLENSLSSKPVEQKVNKKKTEKKVEEEKDDIKARLKEAEEKKMNYMPVYSDDELEELEDEDDYSSKYDEDIDYESYDKYYDED